MGRIKIQAMEQYLGHIRQYLPITFHHRENEDFIEYLSTAYLKNIESQTYQFSFISFHMLYMSFLYKTVWFLRREGVENIEKLCAPHRDLGIVNSPFDFSILPEAAAFNLIKCLKFHPNQIQQFSLPVTSRNHCSHASGYVQYEMTEIEKFVEDEIKYTKTIFSRTGDTLKSKFRVFLDENWDPEKGYSLAIDAINEFIKENLLSAKDIEFLVNYDLHELSEKSNNTKVIYIKVFNLVLTALTQQHFDYDTNLFMDKLPMLLNGFDEQNEITLEQIIHDEFSIFIEGFSEKEKESIEKIITDNKK